MGWNRVKYDLRNKWGKAIFRYVKNETHFYFAHSYYVEPQDEDCILARSFYGQEFCSAVAKENIFGVQFHPEKSQRAGLRILKNFLTL